MCLYTSVWEGSEQLGQGVGLRSSCVQVPETGETQDPGAATRQAA